MLQIMQTGREGLKLFIAHGLSGRWSCHASREDGALTLPWPAASLLLSQRFREGAENTVLCVHLPGEARAGPGLSPREQR